MNKIIEIVQYLFIRIIASCFLVLSLDNALKGGRFLGHFIYVLGKKYRQRTYQHLNGAYQNKKSPQELKALSIKVFEHFGMMFAELVFLPRKIAKTTYHKYVSIQGLNYLDEALKQGRGAILFSAHFGNWELFGYLMGLLSYPLNSVARFMDNPLIDIYLNYFRKYRGQKVIYRENALRDMLKALKSNQFLGILADQDARDAGIFVDFFGQPSSAIRSPALLHMRLGAPLIPFYCYRHQPNKFQYTLLLGPPLEIKLTNDSTTDLVNITQSFTANIEKMVSQYPEQWLWLHRRWKTKPPVDKS